MTCDAAGLVDTTVTAPFDPGPCAGAPDAALHAWLLQHAREPHACATQAWVGVMALAHTRPEPYRQALHRLDAAHWRWLSDTHFCGLPLGPMLNLGMAPDPSADRGPVDEFDDLVELLLSHATAGQDPHLSRCLAHAVATAAMGSNHLWQDLGLRDRATLGQLMREHFAPLKARNHSDMRWKKFFYRALCEAAEVLICKSPSCASCIDQPQCFGVEVGAPLLPNAIRYGL